ncbi:hypothetical protein MACJ_001798 [Theileria orientalis]|uniref:Uncharacterized protein n=1 Tax=Theileria orientalis TaxID=68886 RepID=A0A976M531_THEOR|nr:hypothetical protein MACJ_001798 [Theileria orientalis]
MASKNLGLILIAASYCIISAAIDPTVLDICNYSVNNKRVSCRPEKYGLLKFNPDDGMTFTSAVYGPIKIWDSGSSDYWIRLLELDTFDAIPQLVTIHITDGVNYGTKYYKWYKGEFVVIKREDSFAYRTSLTQGVTVDNSVYLDLKKELNRAIFESDDKEYHGVRFSIVYPKIEYTLVGVFYGTQMVFKSDKVYNVVIKKYRNIPRLIMVNSDEKKDLQMFLLKEKWESCNSAEAQKFIRKIIEYEKQHPPIVQTYDELVYTSLQCPLYIPEVYNDQQIKSMNLSTLCPIYPIHYTPGTSPDPKRVSLDLNDVSHDFTEANMKHDDFDVLNIKPKNGIKVSTIIESGYLVWENEREYWIKEIFVYKRNQLPLLMKLHLYRSGDKTFFFHRTYGKLYPTTKEEFNRLIGRWRRGDTFDKSITYTLYGPNNKFLFKEIHDVEDGVYNLSVYPHEMFDLVRIVNGANELIKPSEEKWPTFTVTFFDSTHKILSLNLVKNDVVDVKHFKCSSYFTELEQKAHQNLFHQYKSQIHIQAEVFFDLSKTEITKYNNLTEKASELIPLSGFYVKMIVHGDFVLWRSHKARCVSVLPIKTDTLNLIRLKILDGNTTSQLYFRSLKNKFIKIEMDEFNFIKRKVVENIRYPEGKALLDGTTNYRIPINNYRPFDASRPTSFSVSHTNLDSFLLDTTYGSREGHGFNKITYNDQVLWQPHNSTHFITKFDLHFFETKPVLGKFHGKINYQQIVEFYDFSKGYPILLDKTNFDQFYHHYSDKVERTVLENRLKYTLVLDLLKYDNYNATGKRWDELISIEYVHKDQLTVEAVFFGYEILWASVNGERAKKVVAIYYERFPMIIQLHMTGTNLVRYISHYNSLWHEINPNTLKSEMQTLLDFEPKRIRFTLPDLNEATDYDDSSFKGGNFTARKFISKNNLVTTILDGRNKLYSPDSFSFIECILLYYHGNTPKLLSFREKNLFGYSFDHYFAFKNGWRHVSFSLFEQFYNHFVTKTPKELCIRNSFVYDILKKDNRVNASIEPNKEYLLKFEVTDFDYSISSVRNGDVCIWEAPKKRILETFYIYRDKKTPVIAKVIEIDCNHQKQDIFIKLVKNEWKEVDLSQFNDAVKDLVKKFESQKPAPETESPDSSDDLLQSQPRRRGSRTGSYSTQDPYSDSTLDLSQNLDTEKYKFLNGFYERVVPFNYYEPKAGIILKGVKIGEKFVWRTRSDVLSCASVKCYFRDNLPVLFEILIADSSKARSKKFKYITYDSSEGKWKTCDQTVFDTSLRSLTDFLLPKTNPLPSQSLPS